MKEALQGRRLGFAPRPVLGATALGVGLSATLLDLVAWFELGTRATVGVTAGARFLVGAAAILCLLAFITAVAETADLEREDRNLGRLDLGALALGAVLYGISATLRALEPGAAAAGPAPFLIAIAALLLLLVGTALGASLYAAREWTVAEVHDTRDRPRRRAASSR